MVYRNLFGRTAATFFEKSENTTGVAEVEVEAAKEVEVEVESGAVEVAGGTAYQFLKVSLV